MLQALMRSTVRIYHSSEVERTFSPALSACSEAVCTVGGVSTLSTVVLAQTEWTLTGKHYLLDKGAICEAVPGLVGDGAFRFENSQVVWSALMDY